MDKDLSTPRIKPSTRSPKSPLSHTTQPKMAQNTSANYTTWHPRQRSHSTTSTSDSDISDFSPNNPTPIDPSIYPNGKKSLSAISIRAFLLGTTLGLTTSLTIYTSILPKTNPIQPFWRIPFFISSLSLFHFLEFFITAHYNTSQAYVSSFLLTSNGWAYNAAHGSALLECLITLWLFPNWSSPLRYTWVMILGFALMALGQTVRSLAMALAAANFNHHVQSRRKDGHVLVTDGIYGILRHPSYFGFFWWGLGTQLVLGNLVCLGLYATVLWRFFSKRIKTEESFLISFFGDDYVQYRKNTRVGIPGIA